MKKCWNADDKKELKNLYQLLSSFESFTNPTFEDTVRQWISDKNIPIGKIMNLWRIAIIGINQGPNVFAICSFLGKDETLKRIERLLAVEC